MTATEPTTQGKQLDRMMKENEMSVTERRAYLQNELDRAKAEMKDLEAKMTSLEKVVAKQAESQNAFVPRYLAQRVRDRVKAGQPTDKAWDAVMAQIRAKAEEELAAITPPTAEEPATEQAAS